MTGVNDKQKNPKELATNKKTSKKKEKKSETKE